MHSNAEGVHLGRIEREFFEAKLREPRADRRRDVVLRPSSTRPHHGRARPASLDRLREITAAVRVPVVAIGGINASNIAEVVEAGAAAAAVISAVCGAADPRAAAAELAAAFD